MKKMILAVTLLIAAVTASFAENTATTELNASVVGVRTLGDDAHWRIGISLPVFEYFDKRSATGANVWVLTDAEDMRRLFVGGGISGTLYRSRNFDFGLTAGWSADFSDIERVKDGRWAVGAFASLKF